MALMMERGDAGGLGLALEASEGEVSAEAWSTAMLKLRKLVTSLIFIIIINHSLFV